MRVGPRDRFPVGGRRRRRALLVTLLALSAVVALYAPSPGLARPSGIGEAKEGCACHSISGDAPQAVLEGLPGGGYGPGETYRLVIRAVGGAPVEDPPQQNLGGFALHATAGGLSPADDTTQIISGLSDPARHDLTHTEGGNDRREWNATWTAPRPASGEVRFYLSVNTVNGDGSSLGDAWAKAEFSSKPAGGGGGPPAPGLGPLPVHPGLGAALMFGGVSLLLSVYALTLPLRETSPHKEVDVSRVRVDVTRPGRKSYDSSEK